MDPTPASPRYSRVVDRLSIHGEPIDFRELCRRAIPHETRYLILDLDRTTHLGRNMGELLGWELCAYHGYGPDRLVEVEARRPRKRLFFDWERPASVPRYLALTAREWAWPGLFYFCWGKLPARLDVAARCTYRAFGPEPVAAVQRLPQTVLMNQMATLPAATLRALAAQVWERYRGDQVIEADDLAWLRSRCPGIRIVITSASPQPTLEVAADALGVDHVIFSAVGEHDGYFSSPYELRGSSRRRPRRISGPGEVRINSGRAKIATLLSRFPDLLSPGVVSVGVSDTGYGEDHCWVGHFTRVIDVNSATPFPPIVRASSPLQEIHSAAVLTRSERARRATGDAAYGDPRRAPRTAPDRIFSASALRERLARSMEEVEALSRRFAEQANSLSAARQAIADELREAWSRIDLGATDYNLRDGSSESERGAALARLRREVRNERQLRRRLARLERPLSRIAFELGRHLAAARTEVADSSNDAAELARAGAPPIERREAGD